GSHCSVRPFARPLPSQPRGSNIDNPSPDVKRRRRKKGAMPITRPAWRNSRISKARPSPKWFHQARFHSQVWNGDGTSSWSTSWFQSVCMASKSTSVVTSRIATAEETASGASRVSAIASAHLRQPARVRPGSIAGGRPGELLWRAAVVRVGGELQGKDARDPIGQRRIALGELQLAGRFCKAIGQRVEHRLGDDVAAEDREVGSRVAGLRLLHQLANPQAARKEFAHRHAEAGCLRHRHLADTPGWCPGFKPKGLQVAPVIDTGDDVVRKEERKRVLTGELATQQHRLARTPGPLLDEGEPHPAR